jgi:uncharacterized YokU family protein
MSEAICEWCGGGKVVIGKDSVYWELPDGTRAIEITDTPTVSCQDCMLFYQEEAIVKEIENQLYLVDTKNIEKSISYEQLMQIPRLLKKNYFDFQS